MLSAPSRSNVIAAFIAVILVGPLLWWTFDREQPYILHSGVIEPDPVRAGGNIQIRWRLRVIRTGCEGTFQREIVDSTGYVWVYEPRPTQFARMSRGEHLTRSPIPFKLPSALPPGDATITYSRMEFYCNPLQSLLHWPIRFRSENIKFKVVP